MSRWISISQPASGGGRGLGLTIPIFAAVASFYGDEHSPVLLDDAEKCLHLLYAVQPCTRLRRIVLVMGSHDAFQIIFALRPMGSP